MTWTWYSPVCPMLRTNSDISMPPFPLLSQRHNLRSLQQPQSCADVQPQSQREQDSKTARDNQSERAHSVNGRDKRYRSERVRGRDDDAHPRFLILTPPCTTYFLLLLQHTLLPWKLLSSSTS
ncbi:unnamed protein product [Pleuronectes platessa]|uniref:Uncharacterized protein n=1 Tax=Pleuronectes platessa TaxID=8262 RepID=A0A9N7TLC2_PLEPL|nr:unnamed protein product [Pleuronectes platessa]